MGFERFIPPKDTGSRPKVTIRPTGLISFDASAVSSFGLDKMTHAILFFDRTRKIVGVQPTKDSKADGAYKLSKRRRSVSLKAPQFFEAYALTIEQAQRFDVSQSDSDGMLLINLKSVQRRRGRRPKGE